MAKQRGTGVAGGGLEARKRAAESLTSSKSKQKFHTPGSQNPRKGARRRPNKEGKR